MDKMNFTNSKYYTNRELSWIAFNYRVLSEAKDKSIPLFERLKFLSITASNLDEFFMIRVASLKDMVHAGYNKKDLAGMTPSEQLAAINKETHELVNAQYNVYNRSFLPMLKQEGIVLIKHYEELSEEQEKYVDTFFKNDVYPVLTPMAVDSSRPFPLIRNKSLNIGAILRERKQDTVQKNSSHFRALYVPNSNTDDDGTHYDFATVQVPSMLPRLVNIPSVNDSTITFIPLEQIIEKNIDKLFVNYEVVCAQPYRIMRNADLSIEEDEAADLLMEIEKQLKKRQWGEAIRLEIESGTDKRLQKVLRKKLNIASEDIYKINGPLDLTFLMKLYETPGFDHLRKEPYVPQPAKYLQSDEDIFTQIRNHDILLFHPYETFDPVVEFVRSAAKDPNVLAIKQTLYRVSSHSPIIASLAAAAENGKQVTVLVELKARFDEENNILWARKLEQAGCHVLYGLVGLKTHSKITLVVRKEEDGIRRYVHLGTGNYNDSTAKLYTDTGILTCSKPIGEDATSVFNMLSGYSEPAVWNKLSVAPIWLRDKFLSLIEREKQHALNRKPAKIIAKMNSLCDATIIQALYEASSAGVEIHLIVRGICCIKTGIKNVSENIHVRSIVGDFLEHARIFYFANDTKEEIYMGSADWMPRNLDKRVEILFPVTDDVLKEDIKHILSIQLKDNVKAHLLQSDGTYAKIDRRGKEPLNSQAYFCEAAKAVANSDTTKNKLGSIRRFEPMKPSNDSI